MNSETEKSLKGTLSMAPEQDYVIEAGYVYQETDKKKPIIKVIPTLTMKTPKRELVSLKGQWKYKENKSLQGSVTFDVHKLLNKPITFQCDMNQISGKKAKHLAKVIVRSEFLDAKVIGNVESTKKTVNPTVTVEYTLPEAYRSWNNKHTIRSKLTDQKTISHWKYMLNMDYKNQERPHLNVFLKGDFSHSTRHTKADVTIRYGVKVGHPARRITGSASIDHHMNKRAVNVKYKLKTEIGPMDVSVDIQGKYNGNSRTIGSELVANYRKHTVSTSVESRFTTNTKETTAVVEIKTPLHQLRFLNAEVSLDHETKVASSVGSFSSGPNGNRMSYAIDFKMPSNTHNGLALSAVGVLSSPSNSDRKFELHFHHVGGIVNFNTKASLTYAKSKIIKGAISFLYNDLAHVEFEGDIKTPFEGFENNTVKYQHSFSKSEADLTAEITNGFSKRATCMFSFSLVNSTNGRLAMSLKTPSRNNVVSFTYTGPLKNCEGKTEIQVLGYTHSMHIVYMHGHKIKVVLTSSNRSMQVLKVLFNFEVTPTMLNTSALYTFEGSTFEGMVVGVKEGARTEMVLKLRTPFQDFRETGLWYKHYKDWRNQYAAVRFMDGKEITFNITNYRKYKGYLAIFPDSMLSLIELKTPFSNWEILSFRFEKHAVYGGKGYVNTKIMYGNHKKIAIDFYTIDKDPVGPSITFIITTPFEKYKTSKVVINCLREGFYVKGKMNMIISDIVITLYYTGKIGLKEGNMTLHTNFHGYELMEGAYIITDINRLYNATSTFNLNNKTVRTEFVTDAKNGFHSHLTIWTPAENFTNIGFTYDHNLYDYVSELRVRYKDNEVIIYRLTYYPRIKGSHSYKAELITPFTGYERQHILYTDRSQGRKTSNKKITFLTSNGEQLSVSSEYVLPSFVDMNVFYKSKESEGKDLVKLLFSSPSLETVTVKVETKLSLASFGNCVLDYSHFIDAGSLKGALKLERNGTKHIATNVYSTHSTNTFHGSVSINSDVYDFHNITVVVSKEGVFKNVRAKGLISVDESTYETLLSHVQIPGKLRKVGGEITLNWDRKHPSSNLQVQAKLMDRRTQYLLYRDLTLKLMHPTRTVGIIGNVLSSQRQTRSRGEFIWNEADGHSFFYDVDVKDHSRRHTKMFEGTFKVGSPLRSVQMEGSYIKTGPRRNLAGAFSWDAGRDDTKKIGMKAECIFGDRNKQAYLSLRLPSIGKNIKVDTGLLLNDGRSVFNGKTLLSYSEDDRKTILLTSSVDDISSGYDYTKHSFVVGISHPYTDVDVQLTSHIGSSSEQVSAGIEITYLTARRERINWALEGQFNMPVQMLKLKMHCPIKDLEAFAEMRESRFKVVISNRSLTAVLLPWKAVELETHFDPDHPGKTLHVNARYVNSSAIKAEVYHLENSRRIFDSLVALRLNTSRLLHTRISWRPQMMADVQAFLTRKVESYGLNAKATLDSVYKTVGEELSGKYHRIAQATKEDLSPYLSLLVSEMAVVENQLDSIWTDIRSIYKRNDFYLADIGYYPDAAEKLYKHVLKPFEKMY
ncbi:uncharacterized protein LOC124266912 [Haliotis rubra]|uniref:uncharacterized protein LOC124266912 n=1 Tax=Haliotis rubra TaxID=36100 RepID=UPI001EE633A4|nr:uncharacterized protein LOC124266912 [Haliotis rubra]